MAASTTRSLAGSVSVITGASAGIGAATARALVDAGGRVVLGARRVNRLEALVGELGADHAIAVPGDARDSAYNDALVAAAVERWGRLDAAIPNAGIGNYGGITDMTDDDVREMVDTNYTATVWLCRSAVRRFREQAAAGGEPGGDVVIVSSVAGFRGGADEAVYAGTKHAQVGLGGSMDRELRGEGIRTTLICPAGTATEFAIGAGRTAGSPELDAYLRAEDVAHAVRVVLEQPRSVRTTVWQLWSWQQPS